MRTLAPSRLHAPRSVHRCLARLYHSGVSGRAGYFVQFTESTQPSHTSTTTQAPTDMDTADSASVSTGTTQPAKVRATHDVHVRERAPRYIHVVT